MPQNIEKLVAKILRISAKKINPKTSPSNTRSWDSLAHVNLIAALESDLKIKLSLDDVLKISNFGDIKKIVEEKLKKS